MRFGRWQWSPKIERVFRPTWDNSLGINSLFTLPQSTPPFAHICGAFPWLQRCAGLGFQMDGPRTALDVHCATIESKIKKVFRCVPNRAVRYGPVMFPAMLNCQGMKHTGDYTPAQHSSHSYAAVSTKRKRITIWLRSSCVTSRPSAFALRQNCSICPFIGWTNEATKDC